MQVLSRYVGMQVNVKKGRDKSFYEDGRNSSVTGFISRKPKTIFTQKIKKPVICHFDVENIFCIFTYNFTICFEKRYTLTILA